jgi:hypothetical protein
MHDTTSFLPVFVCNLQNYHTYDLDNTCTYLAEGSPAIPTNLHVVQGGNKEVASLLGGAVEEFGS